MGIEDVGGDVIVSAASDLPNENLTSVDALIAQAVEKLRPVQRRVMQLRLQNAKFRERVGAEVAMSLFDDAEFVELVPGFAIAAGREDFAYNVGFSFDPSKLAAILDLILKYLPLFLKFFS
jgi:hypothetical protein